MLLIVSLLIVGLKTAFGQGSSEVHHPDERLSERISASLQRFCVECHGGAAASAGLDLNALVNAPVNAHPAEWEKVVRRLRVRQMPPEGAMQPADAERATLIGEVSSVLDRLVEVNPRPGRTETIRRLTRTEYQNMIRDVLGLKIDAAALLPPDESGEGFDNVTVSDLSPTRLSRYVTAAQKIAAMCVNRSRTSPDSETIRVPADLTQEGHLEGMPPGTRGGVLISYLFPKDGDYDIEVRLARDRNEEVEGLKRAHQLEFSLDRQRVGLFEIKPPADADHSRVDAHLKNRIAVAAGQRELALTFLKNSASLMETRRQPLNARFNVHRHPRTAPAVFQVTITGPWNPSESGTSDVTRRILAPGAGIEDRTLAAKRILTPLIRLLYRRPVDEPDLTEPLRFFSEFADESPDRGIEAALAAILVNPGFLLRIERDPPDAAPGAVYPVSSLELASRLSFFLWGSCPDESLLETAIRDDLRQPEVLRRETLRMLQDPRADSLASSFAGQWLYLRNLSSVTPDLRLFPDFDENLRQSFRGETELCFLHVLRDNRSLLELLKSNYTFLNERLARHYGVPHVYGSHFRKVQLAPEWHRGGLLRHGSILTVTSYATRTSPVIRGHWVLKNLLGSPPPPPPANVPALRDRTLTASASVRERLAEHRADAACASCHNLIDPVGFALENYDAAGRWRMLDAEQPVDVSGMFTDGRTFQGVGELEELLLNDPEVFLGTLAEKLLTYALGRAVTEADGPAIRTIVRATRLHHDQLTEMVCALVDSVPFRLRQTPH